MSTVLPIDADSENTWPEALLRGLDAHRQTIADFQLERGLLQRWRDRLDPALFATLQQESPHLLDEQRYPAGAHHFTQAGPHRSGHRMVGQSRTAVAGALGAGRSNRTCSRSSDSRYAKQPRMNFGHGGTATIGSIRSGNSVQSSGGCQHKS
jgi:hypothetical protein